MFLVQKLYTIHPESDSIIEQILSELPNAFLVLHLGEKLLLVDQLTARWRRRLSETVYKRMFFIPAFNETDALAKADIVLELFLGRVGRTSFNIFSVGTPIVPPYQNINRLMAASSRIQQFFHCC